MKKHLVYCIIILFFVSSCKEKLVELNVDNQITKEEKNKIASTTNILDHRDGEIILGKKLDNPYTVENMQKAFSNLLAKNNKSGKVASNGKEIKATHLYIRWLPRDWDEYDALKNDKKLLLYDIPLDYEVKVIGNKYHDNTIPEDLPTWQYTVIEKDYKFNKKLKYEILAEAYIPEKDTELQKKGGRIASTFSIDELINEALTITNNERYLIPLDSKKARASNWRPAGRVTVYDTRIGAVIGVQGVYVRARRFLSIESGVTNANGDYVAGGTFGGGADYALYWEAQTFDVRSGGFGQAWVNGPYLASNWNPHFQDGLDRFYAHVFRGAWRYNQGLTFGLSKPYSFYSNAIKYAAMDSQGGGDAGINTLGIFNNVRVWRWSAFSEYSSDTIFGTTIHETAHVTHRAIMSQFEQVSLFLVESWATGVEFFITKDEYLFRGVNNYGSPSYYALDSPAKLGHQYWKKDTIEPKYRNYSNLFTDLVDNYNQFGSNFYYGLSYPTITDYYYDGHQDNVQNYVLSNIESTFLKDAYGLSSLSLKLKQNKPGGVTDSQIDELINQY